MVRPTTPRSPVPTVSAFETIEDSDDDDENIAPDAKNNAVSLLTNGTIVSPKMHMLILPSYSTTFIFLGELHLNGMNKISGNL